MVVDDYIMSVTFVRVPFFSLPGLLPGYTAGNSRD